MILIFIGGLTYMIIEKTTEWDVSFFCGWVAMDIYWEFFRKSKER